MTRPWIEPVKKELISILHAVDEFLDKYGHEYDESQLEKAIEATIAALTKGKVAPEHLAAARQFVLSSHNAIAAIKQPRISKAAAIASATKESLAASTR